jgi:hypothetical protein
MNTIPSIDGLYSDEWWRGGVVDGNDGNDGNGNRFCIITFLLIDNLSK